MQKREEKALANSQGEACIKKEDTLKDIPIGVVYKYSVGDIYTKVRRIRGTHKDLYYYYLAVPVYKHFLNKVGKEQYRIYGSIELMNLENKKLQKGFWDYLKLV